MKDSIFLLVFFASICCISCASSKTNTCAISEEDFHMRYNELLSGSFPKFVTIGTNVYWLIQVKPTIAFPDFPQSFYVESVATTNDMFCFPSLVVPGRWEVNIHGELKLFNSTLEPIKIKISAQEEVVAKSLGSYNRSLSKDGSFIVTLISVDKRPKDDVLFMQFIGEAESLMDPSRRLQISHIWK